MTQEEKAKAYGEAIKRAKAIYYQGSYKPDTAATIAETLRSVFPELAESEDERIRKVLVDFFKSYKEQGTCGAETFNGISTDNILAWLEKQGEQKPFDYENANIQQKDFAPKETVKEAESNLTPLERKVKDILFSFHIKAADGISFDGTMAIVHNLITLCQQEQKHAEKKELKKIEQKFNIGDEIKTANEEPLTITKIDEKGYWSEDLFICGFDDTAKWEVVGQKTTWSEEDEKIGKEILDYIIKGSESCYDIQQYGREKFEKWIAWLEKQVPVDEDEIVKGIRRGVAISLMNHIDANSKGMCLSNMECEDIENAIVNEDWDKVYGYMKKKLEKQGEQNHFMIQWKGDNLKEVIDFTGKDKNFEKWFKSFEEYEKYVQEHDGIFKLFNADGSHYEVPVGAWIVKTPDGYNVASKAIFRQKSVDTPKFKVEQTTVWSEEDDGLLELTVAAIEDFYDDKNPLRYRLIEWLKSLSHQNRWKPSEEQMKAIEFMVRSFGESGTLSPYGETMAYATSLLNDLKKLKA